MPFKSKAQRRKFAQLLVDGKITDETYEEWNRSTGRSELPERVGHKAAPAAKRPTAKRATTKPVATKRAAKRPAKKAARKAGPKPAGNRAPKKRPAKRQLGKRSTRRG